MKLPSQIFALCLSFVSCPAHAIELPSVRAKAEWQVQASPSALAKSWTPLNPADHWWVQVHDYVYHTPSSILGLSQNISKYYYALGSDSALPDKLRQHRVGGEGRWHIFYLPQGPGMVAGLLQTTASRRASLSALQQLRHGMVLSGKFPSYDMPREYVHPLSGSGQVLELNVVSRIREETLGAYLSQLTTFPTRSWSNGEESEKVEEFIKRVFMGMGLQTCFHDFYHMNQKLTNVVAHVAGQSADSVTVGAHYDSRPFDGAAPGAEDNGSGVAALLAIARAFKASKISPKLSVNFVAFAGEEPGLLGSKAFAESLESGSDVFFLGQCRHASSFLQMHQSRSFAKGATHRALILDEVGWKSPHFDKPTVNLESYDWTHDMMDHLRASSLLHNGDSLAVIHNSNPFGSDHMSFLTKQMGAVLSINADDEAYPNYHKSSDTIGNVNSELMTKIAKMNLGALIRMAGVDS